MAELVTIRRRAEVLAAADIAFGVLGLCFTGFPVGTAVIARMYAGQALRAGAFVPVLLLGAAMCGAALLVAGGWLIHRTLRGAQPGLRAGAFLAAAGALVFTGLAASLVPEVSRSLVPLGSPAALMGLLGPPAAFAAAHLHLVVRHRQSCRALEAGDDAEPPTQ